MAQNNQQHSVLPPQQYSSLPPLQPPQRTYSPYGQQSPPAMSPGGVTGPPMKRPRLSPTPTPSPYSASPYVSSPYATSPTGQYLSPHGPPPSMQPPMPSFHQPQPFYHQQQNDVASRAPAVGTMGPPKVPYSKTTDSSGLDKAERSTNINDLSDIITVAGIDERAEEDYLSMNYRNQHHNASFVGSFNSQSSSTVSPSGSFQFPQGQHGAFQGSGPLSQPPVPERTLEQQLNDSHQRAARAVNEAQQYHLNDPFLFSNIVRHKLHQRAYEHGITINVNGLFDKIPETPTNVQQTVATGADGTSIAVRQGDSILSKSAPMVDILTLISLAAQDRVRSVLDEAYGLARGRQVGSHGLVPPEWADLAVGAGAEPATAVPAKVTKSAWEAPDSAVSPMTVPGIKRKRSESNTSGLPSPPTDSPPTPRVTVQIPNSLATSLRKIAARERRDEEDRLARRAKRQRVSQSAAAASPSIPGTPSEIIPEKMTKKERDRLNKIDQSQDVLHRNANATASMALGGGKKKYSWMTGGAKPAAPSRINTTVGGGASSSTGAAGPTVDRLLVARDRRFGEFREDGPKGKGIQLRDVIHVLDLDGKERKTLMRALVRLKSNEV